jgi:hypothetical protein
MGETERRIWRRWRARCSHNDRTGGGRRSGGGSRKSSRPARARTPANDNATGPWNSPIPGRPPLRGPPRWYLCSGHLMARGAVALRRPPSRSDLGAGRSPAPGELALAFTRIRNRAARAARTDTSGPTAHSGTAQKQRPRRRAAPDASAWANAGVSSSVARAGGGGPTRQSGPRRASACSSRLGRSARAAANVPRGRDTPPRGMKLLLGGSVRF